MKRRVRLWVALGFGGLGAVAVFVLVWFQPQKLFIDDKVEEAIPTIAPPTSRVDATTAATSSPSTSSRTEPVELGRGEFISLDHGTSGVVRVLDLGGGRRVVRLESLDTSNGPDLYLYLTTNPARGAEAGFDDDIVNLGRLKGNQGDQNYDVPGDVDLGRFASVVIWCDRFNSAFGAAELVR